MNKIYEKIKRQLYRIENLKIQYNVPMKEYTTFKIGGPVDILAIPENTKALKQLLPVVNGYQIPVFILGKGSNVIVSDRGYRGLVIYTGKLNKVEIRGSRLTAETGITLAALAGRAMEAGLSGLEFASGIPGSLGGALYMNAGAYDGEMKEVISSVQLLDYSGKTIYMTKKELKLSYRYSILQQKKLIAITVDIELKKDKPEKIKSKMKQLNKKRKEKQPLEWPSAGSIFKRPEGHYTGALIEKAGLKGLRVGDAQISEKHAGFIINRGNATAADVKNLIERIQKEIFNRNGIKLKVEPRFIGEF